MFHASLYFFLVGYSVVERVLELGHRLTMDARLGALRLLRRPLPTHDRHWLLVLSEELCYDSHVGLNALAASAAKFVERH